MGKPGNTLAEGWERFTANADDSAEAAFAGNVNRFPTGTLEGQQARFGWATVRALRRPDPDFAGARADYEAVIAAENPAGDLAAWSLLALARMETEPGRARAAYERLIGRFADHAAGAEAVVHQQATYFLDGRRGITPEQARGVVARLERFVGEHGESPWVAAAQELLAAAHGALGEETASLAAAVRAAETTEPDPENPGVNVADDLWRLGTQAEFAVGDFDTARRFYGRFITEYPADDRVYGAKLALRRMTETERRLEGELRTQTTP